MTKRAMDYLLTLPEAAKELKITPAQVRYLVRTRQVRHYHEDRRRAVMIPLAEIQLYKERKGEQSGRQ